VLEKDFDIPFIANLALREKQNQQNYWLVIAVHKWFARCPGILFWGLLLSEFALDAMRDSSYQSNCLDGITYCRSFCGRGNSCPEANHLGRNIIGCDINPMAY